MTEASKTISLELASTNFHVEVTPVVSSNIQGIGHHRRLGLIAQFVNGGVYCYPEAPSILCKELLEAESVGKLFHAEVKSKGLSFIKLN